MAQIVDYYGVQESMYGESKNVLVKCRERLCGKKMSWAADRNS